MFVKNAPFPWQSLCYLRRQFAQLRASTFIDVARISCTHQPPANLFSCVCIWLHVLPHLELVAYLATLATGGMFYRVCSCLYVFSCF